MKSNVLARTGRLIAILALALGTGALAQDPRHVTLRGVMNDYTPAAPPVSGPGGSWGLVVDGEGQVRPCRFLGGPDDGAFGSRGSAKRAPQLDSSSA